MRSARESEFRKLNGESAAAKRFMTDDVVTELRSASLRAGAGGRTRTGTGVTPRDFKSLASTIPPRPRDSLLARPHAPKGKRAAPRPPAHRSSDGPRAICRVIRDGP